MPTSDGVEKHYSHGRLLRAIRDGVEQLGKSPETICVVDLAPVDDFHIGGRIATQTFLAGLDIGAGDHVLDVGCGLGGASRFVAEQYGCRVTGIDLTAEYVRTGEVMCAWVGLDDLIALDWQSCQTVRGSLSAATARTSLAVTVPCSERS